jgi:glycine cleavage system H protein
MSRPADLKYTRTHEWARVEGPSVTVGITDHAVEQLSDLAFIDLPMKGIEANQGARFGEIESTKTVSDLIAPVSGTIVDVNTEVVENLPLLSNSPFGDGWLIKIEMSDPAELESLLSAVEYQRLIDSEAH